MRNVVKGNISKAILLYFGMRGIAFNLRYDEMQLASKCFRDVNIGSSYVYTKMEWCNFLVA